MFPRKQIDSRRLRRHTVKRGTRGASVLGYVSAATMLLTCGFIVYQRAAAQASPNGAGADWMTFNGSYAGDRFSPLREITVANINRLEQVCMFDTGERTSFQTGPVAIAGRLYFTTYAKTYSIDGNTCEIKWTNTRPTLASGLNVNRGVAYDNGRLFRGTGDAHVIAIDASTGRLIWDVGIGDPARGESIPMAPIAWNGMVFVGNAGGDNFGVTGRIYALSAADGHVIWQFNTVPESGPARATWPNASADNPPTGGATWTSYALDTSAAVLYVPTGNVAPDFDQRLHPGDNLYTTSIVALDTRTGQLLGFVQPTKGDFHDWDIAASPALLTTRSGRPIVAAAGKDGFLYGINRSATLNDAQRPIPEQSTAVALFGAAGRDALTVGYSTAITTHENIEAPFSTTQETRFCPGTQGGVEWNGPAYHPGLNLLFTNGIDWCTAIRLAPPDSVKGEVGKAWTGAVPQAVFGRNDSTIFWRGWITALDADTGNVKWKYQSPTPMVAAVTATAGGLLLTGDLNGFVLAFDAATGQVVWQSQTGEPIGGGVVSFNASNGRQRIAVAAAMKSPLWPVPASTARVIVYGLRF